MTLPNLVLITTIFSFISAQNLQRQTYLSKNPGIVAPAPGEVSSIQVAGCEFACTGIHCEFSDPSTDGGKCSALIRKMGGRLYMYQETPPTLFLSTFECGRSTNPGHSEKYLFLDYGPISGVTLWLGGILYDYVLGIRFQYGTTKWGAKHGMTTGRSVTYLMTNNNRERISMIKMKYGSMVDSLAFSTSSGKEYGPVGGAGGSGAVLEMYQLLYAELYLAENHLFARGIHLGKIKFVFNSLHAL